MTSDHGAIEHKAGCKENKRGLKILKGKNIHITLCLQRQVGYNTECIKND